MNDLYIFLSRRDVRKLTCLTAKFQEKPELCFLRKFQFRTGEEMLEKKLGVHALLR